MRFFSDALIGLLQIIVHESNSHVHLLITAMPQSLRAIPRFASSCHTTLETILYLLHLLTHQQTCQLLPIINAQYERGDHAFVFHPFFNLSRSLNSLKDCEGHCQSHLHIAALSDQKKVSFFSGAVNWSFVDHQSMILTVKFIYCYLMILLEEYVMFMMFFQSKTLINQLMPMTPIDSPKILLVLNKT